MEDQVFEINDSLKLNISNYIRYGSKIVFAFWSQIYIHAELKLTIHYPDS